MPQPHLAQSSVFVALVHETLNAETFDAIADLSEAVKVRAARLRLRYDAAAIAEAIATVAHTRPVIRAPQDRPVSDPPTVPVIGRDEATRILRDVLGSQRGAWTRARWSRRCGYCDEVMRAGDPMLVLTLRLGARTVERVRCGICAGPVPADLPPPRSVSAPAWRPMVKLRTVINGLPLDFKRAASGDREPGEEG